MYTWIIGYSNNTDIVMILNLSLYINIVNIPSSTPYQAHYMNKRYR